MTLCDDCRKPMKIRRVLTDVGEGGVDEEFEITACPDCKIAYVSAYTWRVNGVTDQ